MNRIKNSCHTHIHKHTSIYEIYISDKQDIVHDPIGSKSDCYRFRTIFLVIIYYNIINIKHIVKCQL